ncbi:hypothetical protein D3C73_815890 [compost metagenome]
MRGHGGAADVHVRAAAFLVGERRADDLDGIAPLARVGAGLGVLHVAHVVGVGQADVANAAQDVASHVAVAARGLASQVGFHAAQPFFGGFGAVMRNHGGDHGGVVGVLARTDADLALPLRVGQVFVAEGLQLQVLFHIQHAVAQRQGIPLAVGAAQVGGDHRFQGLRLDRLRHAAVNQVQQVADVYGHEHVGGRLGAFGLDALQQAVLDEHGVDLDAAFFREGVQQRLDQLGFPSGVQADFFGGIGRDGEGGGACQREGAQQRIQLGTLGHVGNSG